jgi:hypothetical protein
MASMSRYIQYDEITIGRKPGTHGCTRMLSSRNAAGSRGTEVRARSPIQRDAV